MNAPPPARNQVTTPKKSALLTACLAACALLAPTQTAAQGNYPERPIRIVVPYPPAGGGDLSTRSVTESFGKLMGQPIVVENKPGATTTIAAESVARAAPDGYTLFIAQPFNFGIDRFFMKDLNYDGARDFAPVTQWVSAPLVLVANNSLPANSVAQLIELLKRNPGKYFYSTVGNGGVTHLAGLYFNEANGINAVQVPYKGGAQGATALMTGEAQFSFASGPSVMPLVDAGKLRALAVTSERRSPVVPGLPSVAESGVKGFEIIVSFGIVGPAGMPAAIIKRLFDASVVALKEPAVIERLAKQAIEASPSASPEAYKAWLIREGAKQAELARKAGAKLD